MALVLSRSDRIPTTRRNYLLRCDTIKSIFVLTTTISLGLYYSFDPQPASHQIFYLSPNPTVLHKISGVKLPFVIISLRSAANHRFLDVPLQTTSSVRVPPQNPCFTSRSAAPTNPWRPTKRGYIHLYAFPDVSLTSPPLAYCHHSPSTRTTAQFLISTLVVPIDTPCHSPFQLHPSQQNHSVFAAALLTFTMLFSHVSTPISDESTLTRFIFLSLAFSVPSTVRH